MRVVSASVDGTIRVWDVILAESALKLVGHTDGVLSAIYRPDGQFIYSGSLDVRRNPSVVCDVFLI
jgi:WD40 repeat protein